MMRVGLPWEGSESKSNGVRVVECLPSHPSQSARWMGHPWVCGWWRRTGNGKDNSGFLRCAAHDETVSSFGRNDGSLFVLCLFGREQAKALATAMVSIE